MLAAGAKAEADATKARATILVNCLVDENMRKEILDVSKKVCDVVKGEVISFALILYILAKDSDIVVQSMHHPHCI